MSNFKELNENLNLVLTKLISSPKLCKLLYYDNPSAMSQADIESPEDLLYTKIFPYPTTTESLSTGNDAILTKASSIMIVGFDNFKSISSNNFIGSILYFRVLCHESLLRTNDGLRSYLIMNEIAELFNKKDDIGVGVVSFDRGGEIREGNSYLGFELIYKITEFS